MISRTESFQGKTVKLGADIDLNPGSQVVAGGMSGTPLLWTPVGDVGSHRFNGTFDGQGHTITGLCLQTGSRYQGFFSGTGPNAVIRNFKLKNSYLATTSAQLGSIAGNAMGTFENIYSDAVVLGIGNANGGGRIGGLIGATSTEGGVTVKNCWFAGKVNLNAFASYLGGLIGEVQYASTITASLNTGEVYHRYTGELSTAGAGGFVGKATASVSISHSVNHSNPMCTSGEGVGYFVGNGPQANVSLLNCHSLHYSGKHLVAGVDEEVLPAPYPTSTRQYKADVAGTNSRTAEKVSMLFTTDGAKGYWICSADSLPVLLTFASEYAAGTIATDLTAFDASSSDVSALSALYSGKKLYQGEMHDHADNGGTSDGTVPLSTWYTEMPALQLDFAASLDHKQTVHWDRSDWDKTKLLYGTEAGTTVASVNGDGYQKFHFDMIFKDKAGLETVLNAYSSFYYNGSTFAYRYFMSRAQYADLIQTVQNAGGFFSMPHPFTYPENNGQVNEYYVGVDYVGFQVIYGDHSSNARMYAGWLDLLESGAKIYATAGFDGHADLSTADLTSIYATSAADSDKGVLIDSLRAGNFTAGSAGIQMSVGNTAMGGTGSFSGKRVVVDVEKLHPVANDLSHTYRLEVYDDQGLVHAEYLTPDANGYTNGVEVAFDADASRKYYRVVVYDMTTRTRIAVGNPIWNSAY